MYGGNTNLKAPKPKDYSKAPTGSIGGTNPYHLGYQEMAGSVQPTPTNQNNWSSPTPSGSGGGGAGGNTSLSTADWIAKNDSVKPGSQIYAAGTKPGAGVDDFYKSYSDEKIQTDLAKQLTQFQQSQINAGAAGHQNILAAYAAMKGAGQVEHESQMFAMRREASRNAARRVSRGAFYAGYNR